MNDWLSTPRDLTASLGDIVRFSGSVFGDILNGRVFHFFGEALRQAGILILGSALVIWGMVFILGLECGIEGGYFLIFWMFQNPPDFFYSVIKGMVMATAIVAVGCYYGYTASGGPVGVGQATAKSMILNMVLVHLIGMMGSQVFWGANPRAPIGG